MEENMEIEAVEEIEETCDEIEEEMDETSGVPVGLIAAGAGAIGIGIGVLARKAGKKIKDEVSDYRQWRKEKRALAEPDMAAQIEKVLNEETSGTEPTEEPEQKSTRKRE